jgi:hypothetical protein
VSRRRLADALTTLAARSFPPSRRADARVVRDCARDAIDGAGLRVLVRECLSLAGAGLRVRARVAGFDLWHAPWRSALSVLALPLAAALLCLWTFGFVPRYDHWPLGEGWTMLLGGSLAAVIGAALRSRWLTALGAAATFVAAASPYVGMGTEVALADTASFFQGSGVDLGAASLLPTLLLVGAALSLPRKPVRSTRDVLDRLVLGMVPTVVALIHLLPRPAPERPLVVTQRAPGLEPTVSSGAPYPLPWLPESETLITALGVGLLVAAVLSWRAARVHPEAALSTALVLAAVAHPVAWVMHGYRVWPLILVPLGAALALMLRGAHAGDQPLITPAAPYDPPPGGLALERGPRTP